MNDLSITITIYINDYVFNIITLYGNFFSQPT